MAVLYDKNIGAYVSLDHSVNFSLLTREIPGMYKFKKHNIR